MIFSPCPGLSVFNERKMDGAVLKLQLHVSYSMGFNASAYFSRKSYKSENARYNEIQIETAQAQLYNFSHQHNVIISTENIKPNQKKWALILNHSGGIKLLGKRQVTNSVWEIEDNGRIVSSFALLSRSCDFVFTDTGDHFSFKNKSLKLLT